MIKQYLALFSTGIPAGGLISGGEEFKTGYIFCFQVHVDGPITGGAYYRNFTVLLWSFFFINRLFHSHLLVMII